MVGRRNAHLMESGGVPFLPHIMCPESVLSGFVEYAGRAVSGAGPRRWRITWRQGAKAVAQEVQMDWCRLLTEAREWEIGWLRVFGKLREALERQALRYRSELLWVIAHDGLGGESMWCRDEVCTAVPMTLII